MGVLFMLTSVFEGVLVLLLTGLNDILLLS